MEHPPLHRLLANRTIVADFGDGPGLYQLDNNGICTYWKEDEDHD